MGEVKRVGASILLELGCPSAHLDLFNIIKH